MNGSSERTLPPFPTVVYNRRYTIVLHGTNTNRSSPTLDEISQVIVSRDRKMAVLLAQLRSGHCSGPAGYGSIIGSAASPICPRCDEEDEDLEHWLQRCPATATQRLRILGGLPPLGVLSQVGSVALPEEYAGLTLLRWVGRLTTTQTWVKTKIGMTT